MGSNTNGISKRPQVTTGEALDPIDFNAQSQWATARLSDLVLSSWMRTTLAMQDPVSNNGSAEGASMFAFTHGAAPVGNAFNLGWTCTEGPIWQPPAAPTSTIDGTNIRMPMYYLQQDEASGTFAAADPTNPRLDAVYLRITEVDGPLTTRFFVDALGFQSGQTISPDKRTKLEWLVVQGTPAAKPRIAAAPDATWSLWGVYHIPAAFAAPFTVANIFDYRVPLGLKRYQVSPLAMGITGAAWTYVAASNEFQSPGGSTVLWVTCPMHSGRVMSAELVYRDTHPDTYNLVVTGRNVGSVAGTTSSLPPGAANGQVNYGQASSDIQGWTLQGGLWVNAAGTVLTPLNAVSTAGYQLLPVWANGFGSTAADPARAGGPQNGYSNSDGEQRQVRVWMDSLGSGRTIVGAHFDIAGA